MPIVPDDKNWTWVLDRMCPECGFDAAATDPASVAALIRSNAGRWGGLIEHPLVRQRPSDDVWSGLEYACHVRDVFRLYLYRLNLMLDLDGPTYPNWDQDQTALDDDYPAHDPAVVSRDLAAAAEQLAARFDEVAEDDWSRTGYRSDGAVFTIASFARYLIHDPIHHIADVERGYRKLAA